VTRTYVVGIDLDGTLCTEERTFDRPLAEPLPGAVVGVRELFDLGHTIVIWTARGWEQFRVTKKWLETHEIPFHALLMGKPIMDFWIDDRAVSFNGWPVKLDFKR